VHLGEYNQVLDRRAKRDKAFRQGREIRADHQDTVLRLADHLRQMLWRQPWVEGVAHNADAQSGIPTLQVRLTIPRQQSKVVATSEAESLKRS
jgi:hypothetical protein